MSSDGVEGIGVVVESGVAIDCVSDCQGKFVSLFANTCERALWMGESVDEFVVEVLEELGFVGVCTDAVLSESFFSF